MKILAIDIGETTGYAFVDGVGPDSAPYTLLSYGTMRLGHCYTLKTTMGYDPDLVVIERPAYIENRMQEQYEAEIRTLRVLFLDEKVKTVRPADWMPRFMHFPLPGRGILKTQHEKEAYRMAQWALEKFGGQK